MLLPAYVYAIYVWHRRNFRDKWFRGLLAASFIFTLITNKGIVGSLLSDVFTASGFNVGGTILLVCAVFRIAHRLPEDDFG